jgi:hypothetical protein
MNSRFFNKKIFSDITESPKIALAYIKKNHSEITEAKLMK